MPRHRHIFVPHQNQTTDGLTANDVFALCLLGAFVITIIAIMYFGLRRIRPKKVDFSQSGVSASEPIELDCTFLFAEADLSHRRARLWTPAGVFLFAGFMVSVIGVGHDVDTTTLIAVGFAVSMVFYLLSWGLYFVQMAPLRKALAAANGVPLTFRIDEMGIQAPVLMITEPAYWRASEKGMSHIVVPWTDVKGIEIYPGMGKARPQMVLVLQGATSELGQATRAIPIPMDRFGIRREPIKEIEMAVFAYAQKHLNDRLVSCDPDLVAHDNPRILEDPPS